MVSTLDSESSDPSSNLGGTYPTFVLTPSTLRSIVLMQPRLSSSVAVIAQLGER